MGRTWQDAIFGGAGDDELHGGPGNDRLVGGGQIQVTFTNLQSPNGALLTPVVFATTNGSYDIFNSGSAASSNLERQAEDGTTEPQIATALASGNVNKAIATSGGPLAPGASRTVTLLADSLNQLTQYLSYTSMVIPSNDAFIGNNDPTELDLFDANGNVIQRTGANALIIGGDEIWDAGTEVNDEIPANTAALGQSVPNTGVTENGVVHLHRGLQGSQALGGPFEIPLFDSVGRLIQRTGATAHIVTGAEVWDAGTEVNDEIPANTAALAQAAPNTGVTETGVVHAHPGFQGSSVLGGAVGNILTAHPGADFTLQGAELLRIEITSLGGNDMLIGGRGTDQINGGEGEDTAEFDYSAAAANLVISSSQSAVQIRDLRQPGSVETLVGIEDISVTAGPAWDVFKVNALAAAGVQSVTISSGDGNSFVNAWSTDVAVNVFAGADRDVIWTGTADDQIHAGDGNDTILSNSGDDTITKQGGVGRILAGHGDDDIIAGGNSIVVFGGNGNDSVEITEGSSIVYGDAGNDILIGGDSTDRFFGGIGDDLLQGMGGNDHLSGDAGDDIIDGGDGADVLLGGIGRDILMGGQGRDELHAGLHDDILIGGSTTLGNEELVLIRNEWSSSRSYSQRLDNIRNVSPSVSRANGNAYLTPQTLTSDAVRDQLFGELGSDAFFGNSLDLVFKTRLEDLFTV